MSTNFSRPLRLSKKVVVLDGLTGTGKTMFSPLISSFTSIQNPRFEYTFEYLAITHYFGKLSPDAAISLLRLMADIKCYDGSISRDVNFRFSDLSGVFGNGNGIRYLRQLIERDGEYAQLRIEKESPSLFLVTHQLLGCMGLFPDAFPGDLRVIEMVRHPLYLLSHWNSYIQMHGANARDFSIWTETGGGSVPWFASKWSDKYLQLSNYDRVIFSINDLMARVYDAIDSWNESELCVIPFERFTLSPESGLKKIERFLGETMTKDTYIHLRRQNVPRKNINEGPVKKIYQRYGVSKSRIRLSHAEDYQLQWEIAEKNCTADALALLKSTVAEYEQRFGLWF